jgi:hypothetical protein
MKNYILYFLILIILSFIIKFIDKINNSSYLENFYSDIENFYSQISHRYVINPNNVDPYYQPFFKNWFFRRGYFYPTN